MRIENGTLRGDVTVDDELELRGRVEGTLTAAAGASVEIYGTVTGDLVVLEGAGATVHGTVGGTVRNAGVVEIQGEVGDVVTGDGGRTEVIEGAVVGAG